MRTNSLSPLLHIDGVVEPPSLAILKTAEEVAPVVHLTPERLRELAEARALKPRFNKERNTLSDEAKER